MTNDQLISLRLPARAVAAIMVEAEASGRTRSEVIRDTLGRVFPITPGYDSVAAKADLARRLRAANKEIFSPKRVAHAKP